MTSTLSAARKMLEYLYPDSREFDHADKVVDGRPRGGLFH